MRVENFICWDLDCFLSRGKTDKLILKFFDKLFKGLFFLICERPTFFPLISLLIILSKLFIQKRSIRRT